MNPIYTALKRPLKTRCTSTKATVPKVSGSAVAEARPPFARGNSRCESSADAATGLQNPD